MSKLTYVTPAAEWSQALPLGNGRIGAMVFGDVYKDHVQLNEDTMWYGGPMDRVNPCAYENLKKVRKLILEGEIAEAETLLRYAFTGVPQSMRHYQSGGDFWLRPADTAMPVTAYKRSLSLRDAVAEVSYRQGETGYTRTYFVSSKLQCLVVEIKADRKGAVNVDGLITRDKNYDTVARAGEDIVMLKGNLGKGGLDFALAFTAVAEGGSVQIIGENVIVRNADSVRFFVTEGTTFHEYWADFEEKGEECRLGEACLSKLLQKETVWQELLEKRLVHTLKAAKETSAEDTLKEHIQENRSYFDRVCLELSSGEDSGNFVPLNERIEAVKQGACDNDLWKLYFDFGRYLMIAGSRPGTMPLNLQGIWNDLMNPPWGSKYTVNINTEMNYWPAEICNLPEFHQPLFELLRRTVKRGQKTAWEMYHCRGFVIHHNTDIWADTAPQDIWLPGTYWVMGGAWLCAHLWEHYLYTQDKDFLASVYDIMEQAVLFFCDYLYEKDGKVILCPSVSPENTYILPNGKGGSVCFNATMDIMILKELLNNYLEASRLLAGEVCAENASCDECGETSSVRTKVVDNSLVQQAEALVQKLPEPRIGRHGQLMEWMEDYEEAEPGHRHISHLYALHPGRTITMDGTPELAEAARTTIERRLANGGGYTGWSCAWLIHFYAKLWDGENAYKMLQKLLTESTFDNLMDNHPGKKGSVFQIDGNMGACAAIANMLIQSNEERVLLLPACPKEWSRGSLSGIRVIGNASFDFTWKNGKVVSCTVYADSDYHCEVCYNGGKVQVTLLAGESRKLPILK